MLGSLNFTLDGLNDLTTRRSVGQGGTAMDDLQHWYSRLTPLFMRAFARMARTSFIARPDDALDLIHDFFLSEWSGVLARFDPSRGKLETYAYGSFMIFARRRIVRLNRWKPTLSDALELASRLKESKDDLNRIDLLALTEVTDRLPSMSKSVLQMYLQNGGSERIVADRLRLTRYSVREALVEALGRLTVWLSEHDQLSVDERNVAELLWRHNLSPREVGQRLRLSTDQVQRIRGRIVSGLIENISTTENRNPIWRVNMTALELLQKTIAGDRQSLDQLAQHSREVFAFLEDHDYVLSPEENHALEVQPELIAEIYDALAGNAKLEEQDEAMLRTTLEIRDSDGTTVGKLFKNSLLRDLPSELVDWNSWFSGLSVISKESLIHLGQRPDVKAASPVSKQIAKYGITPLAVSAATQALRAVARRLAEGGRLRRENSLILALDPDQARQLENAVPPKELTIEISALAGLQYDVAHALLRWLYELASVRAFLFEGFECRPEVDYLRLNWNDGPLSLKEQWSAVSTLEPI